MADSDQQTAEALDDDKLSGEYPPEHTLAVDDQGVTGVEQLGGESVADRDARSEPEVWEQDPAPEASGPGGGTVLEGEAEPGAADEEKDLVAPPVTGEDPGALDPDDGFSGDETTRDIATERAPAAAEDAAVRVDDDAPGAAG